MGKSHSLMTATSQIWRPPRRALTTSWSALAPRHLPRNSPAPSRAVSHGRLALLVSVKISNPAPVFVSVKTTIRMVIELQYMIDTKEVHKPNLVCLLSVHCICICSIVPFASVNVHTICPALLFYLFEWFTINVDKHVVDVGGCRKCEQP